MLEIRGDLFALAKGQVLCITTNGFVKKDGRAVMGRGCARQAAAAWPALPGILGQSIKRNGNVTAILLGAGGIDDASYRAIVAFPVKHAWWELASLELIRNSAERLMGLADDMGWTDIFVPLPGCGNGRLEWAQVKPVLEPYFDDRFKLVSFP